MRALEEDGHEWSPIGREDVEAIASLVRIEESR